jgi:DNA-directed RNA polymerase subunit RPC12/RpoP
MSEDMYLCQQCGNVFRLPLTCDIVPEKEIKCPRCRNSQVQELPSWAPIGSDLYEGTPEWEYECQECYHKFKLPVPGSPSQEMEIKCPVCEGGHIHRLTASGVTPLYCG